MKIIHMEDTNSLRIVKNVHINLRDYFIWSLFIVYLVILPFFIISVRNVQFQSEDTSRLQHDIQTMAPKPQPVPSMWIEYDWFVNDSSYVPFGLWNEGAFETYILHFPWYQQIVLCLNTVRETTLLSIFLQLQIVEKLLNRPGIRRFFIFCSAVVVYSVLLYLALDGTWTTIYAEIRGNFLKWIESNIAELFLDEGFKDETILHPFTLGTMAPFYLKNVFRYPGEDVVFTCQYNVSGDSDVEPDFVTTWWRKNNIPVEVNDRMYVNISIESMDNQNLAAEGSLMYMIRSTLTIEIIQPRDYGSYTCDYVNPMPNRIIVKPYVPKNDSEKVRKPEPMTPHPRCNCQPTFNNEADSGKPNYRSPIRRRVCFSEFELRHPNLATRTVTIRPGGILVSAASYRTVANMSDIKVDVTFEANTDRKGNTECCSMFIKIYWALFRHGSFVDLPISRLMGQHFRNNTSRLSIFKYLCICKNSFGIRRFIFYRDHFNSTIKKEEEIEIKHPVSLRIEPQDQSSNPLFDSFSFCSRSDQNYCWIIETLLENSVYMFYTYDVCFGVIFMILFLSISRVNKWSGNFIAKPLRKLCLISYYPYEGPFPSIEGPPLYLHHSQKISPPDCRYDIYLSYSEDDIYGREVATCMKKLLLGEQMTVFDPVEDILPGRVEDYESAEAIQSCGRFVVIASTIYTEDARKKMEFVCIQDTIVSQATKPKNRLLVILVEDCPIVGLHRVPCIRIPGNLKETFSLDEESIVRFFQWMSATGSPTRGRLTIRNVISKLCELGFTWKSIVFILALMFLAMQSDMFTAQSQSPVETDISRVE